MQLLCLGEQRAARVEPRHRRKHSTSREGARGGRELVLPAVKVVARGVQWQVLQLEPLQSRAMQRLRALSIAQHRQTHRERGQGGGEQLAQRCGVVEAGPAGEDDGVHLRGLAAVQPSHVVHHVVFHGRPHGVRLGGSFERAGPPHAREGRRQTHPLLGGYACDGGVVPHHHVRVRRQPLLQRVCVRALEHVVPEQRPHAQRCALLDQRLHKVQKQSLSPCSLRLGSTPCAVS
mmetsp:Transcript_14441/g.27785  ORF Transcript_14441/g.27785 Transcript_14441/m.27785 type:complete len:233 (-) Transcript_14441:900-1598(-)